MAIEPENIKKKMKKAMDDLNHAKNYLDSCISAAREGGWRDLGERAQLAKNGKSTLWLTETGKLEEVTPHEPDPDDLTYCLPSLLARPDNRTPLSTMEAIKKYNAVECANNLFEFIEKWNEIATHKKNSLVKSGILERIEAIAPKTQPQKQPRKLLPGK